MNPEIKQALFRTLPFLLLILGIAFGIRTKRLNPRDLHLSAPTSYSALLRWWLGFLLYVLLTEVVLYQLGLLQVSPWRDALLPSLIKLAGMVILAPIGEELLFRGVLLARLQSWKVGKHAAILIQAVLFVLVHSAAFSLSLTANIGKVQLFVDSLIFAYALYATRSIFTPMALHATGNAIAALEQFVL